MKNLGACGCVLGQKKFRPIWPLISGSGSCIVFSRLGHGIRSTQKWPRSRLQMCVHFIIIFSTYFTFYSRRVDRHLILRH
jgi:hypothetical protein